jgi:hypothetical protein
MLAILTEFPKHNKSKEMSSKNHKSNGIRNNYVDQSPDSGALHVFLTILYCQRKIGH